MFQRRFRLTVERLERRCMLAGTGFEDGGQTLDKNSFGVPLGDLDNDGDLDAFVSCFNGRGFEGQCRENSAWLNDGEGNLTRGWSDRASNVMAVALGDLDGDGDLDAFLGRGTPFSNATNQVWLNDGNADFTNTGQRIGRGISTDVALGDVDGDDDLDAIVANSGDFGSVSGAGYPSRLWLNDGQGNFAQSPTFNVGTYVMSVALGDLDGDGDLDAYLGRLGVQAITKPDLVLLNDGQGNFTDSGQRLGQGWANAVKLGDLDGDSDLDAFVANGDQFGINQPNEVWLNDGAGNFANTRQRIGRGISRWAELGDLDGDGDLDAFVANGTSAVPQANRIWLNDGSGTFSESQRVGRASGSIAVALGDLDADGDLDAIVGNLGRANNVFLNAAPTAGDANGDGRFDQLDIVQVLSAAKYNTGDPADWSQGDWNGDEVFDQLDIVAALKTGNYSTSRPS